MRTRPLISILILFTALLAGACGKKEEAKPAAPATLVTLAQAQTKDLEVLEETVGAVESIVDPRIAAEVAGRVVRVPAGAGQEVRAGQLLAVIDAQDIELARRGSVAEVHRLQALSSNQKRIVERNRRLRQSNFIAQSVLDDALAQETAFEEQITGAHAALARIDRDLQKTQVVAPFDGRVETQIVTAGSYVKVGDPLFHLVASRGLRAHLPFPEGVASKLRVGQPVRLTTPTSPEQPVLGRIEDIKPMIGAANRALEAIVRVDNLPGWRPGASVNAAVVVGQRTGAVVAPEASVVLRPAGKVVYVASGNKAVQRMVQTGVVRDGWVEITSGISAGETIVVDGAGFLTDQAPLMVQGSRP